ncbi:hypothetical protein GCM10008986_13420 [Salinibacillus aidingensis]|uniref:Uncharacterized protein n=1 Tax=Salinibacillus aidingensis TaxID=237684 RepID=A0ABP3L1T0_9BACI
MKAEDIVEAWKTKMKCHAGLKKAQALIELFKQSVGTHLALDAYKLHLEQLLAEFELATAQLERVEMEVTKALDEITFAREMLAMKGISKITLAAF